MGVGVCDKICHNKQWQDKRNGDFRERLGEVMESARVAGVVLLLILVDLACTFLTDLLENTDLLNPKYEEEGEVWAHNLRHVGITILVLFLVEQCLHLLAFGADFFTDAWYVMDLVVVSISLSVETVFAEGWEDWAGLLIGVRLWKVIAFTFDVMIANKQLEQWHKDPSERDIQDEYTIFNTSMSAAFTGQLKLTDKLSHCRSCQNNENWRKLLGEILESTLVSAIVVILIFVDLACTGINDLLENTDLLNPKYVASGEVWATKTGLIGLSIHCLFLIEQVLHIAAFGESYFSKPWCVCDLIVVSTSLFCETVLAKQYEWVGLLLVLRLWKVVAVIFHILIADQELANLYAGEEETPKSLQEELWEEASGSYKKLLAS